MWGWAGGSSKGEPITQLREMTLLSMSRYAHQPPLELKKRGGFGYVTDNKWHKKEKIFWSLKLLLFT